MQDLEKARKTINETDKKIAELFCKRMEAVKSVAEYKISHCLPVFDAAREKKVIEQNSAFIDDSDLLPYYVDFLQNMMDVSKRYQRKLMDGFKVSYSGGEGAFAHIAAKKIFPGGNHTAYSSFEDAYRSVVIGECDCAVLPIENSYAGEVGQVLDLMFSGDLHISGVFSLKVSHSLLGIKGTKIEDVKTVISHLQALSQCERYIHNHSFDQLQASNTAKAAQFIAQKGDVSVAAIASAESAELYGLSVLERDINESSTNTTRFAIFSRTENTKFKNSHNNFILLFTVNNTPGALAKAINIIGKHGFNMKVLRSRPMKDSAWQYYFYVEAEGDETSEAGKNMLTKLEAYCNKLKVVGHYSEEFEFDKEEEEK